jgi:hypothetical protein
VDADAIAFEQIDVVLRVASAPRSMPRSISRAAAHRASGETSTR